MRLKEPFVLIKRKGSDAWYYRYYDELGSRRMKSTGMLRKSDAYAYAMGLYKSGSLGAETAIAVKFGDFAREMFRDGTSGGRKISPSTQSSYLLNLKNHILPYWKDRFMGEATRSRIERWLMTLKREKGMSKGSLRVCLAVMLMVLKEARRQGLCSPDLSDIRIPADAAENEKRGILTVEETRKLFSPEAAWPSQMHRLASMLSACTGMRINEVSSLRGEDVLDGAISVSHQYQRFDGKEYDRELKSHKPRVIPIPRMLSDALRAASYEDPQLYIFSDSGKRPWGPNAIRSGFYEALKSIGIDEAKRVRRKIVFHSFRHFVATRLEAGNIADSKVMAITGHSSIQMVEHYTHLSSDDLKEILDITGGILEAEGKGKG